MGKGDIMNTYHIPGNQQIMDDLYVVLSKDDKGEGIVSMMTPDGAMPLVFGHKRLLDTIMPVVEQIAKDTRQTLLICKFQKIQILKEIKGGS